MLLDEEAFSVCKEHRPGSPRRKINPTPTDTGLKFKHKIT